MHKAASHLSRALKAVFATVFAFVALIAVNAPQASAAAGVRANVTYQARLMDASGYPVADGVYQVRFSIYDAAVAGTRLWTADGTLGAPLPVNVSVQDGLFTVLLGDGVTQLPFGDLDWNSDSLYLGVTIGADAEMSPRRPITAVPQAINSAQLSGMSASSSDTYGGQSQFTITQASTTAATSTRSALDVRSNGSSVANDFIFRAIGSTGVPLFTINSQGTVSTTDLLVDGVAVCRADGTDCLPVASGTSTLQDVYDQGNVISLTNNALTLQVVASGTNLLPFPGIEGYASFVSQGFGQGGLGLIHSSSSGANVDYLFFTSDVSDPINATSSYIASVHDTGNFQISGANDLGITANNGDLSLQTLVGTILLNAPTTTVQGNFSINGGSIEGNANPFLDNAYTLGSNAFRWIGYFSNVSTSNLTVAGQSVCLLDGTNCPVAGATTLQAAYDGGNAIVAADGAIILSAASTVTIGGDSYSPVITGDFASGTNEGFDLSLFANNSNPYLTGTGTSLIYRQDRTLAPGSTTSSGIGFSADDSEGYLTLFSVRPGGFAQNIGFNGEGITIFPGAGATTTFAQNVALESTARIDSDLIPRYDGTFAIGNDANRWNGSFVSVTSTYQHLQSAVNPSAPYSGAMLINNIAQGVTAGLDIVTVATSTPTQLDNILFLYRADRTVMDQYAELVMGQDSADGYHKLLLEVKEGVSENDLEMTPTSTKLGGDLLPKNDNTYWLGSQAYRWNGYFGTVSTSNIFVGGQSVCLQNGVNCPSAGAVSLQNAYDNGRFITQTNGQIAITSVTGTASDLFVPGVYEATATRVFGAGNQLNNAMGFDLSVVNENESGNPGSGTLFTFTDNRFDPFSSAKTSFLRHNIGNGNENVLEMGNVTNSVRVTDSGVSLSAQLASVQAAGNTINLIAENNSGAPVFISNESLTSYDALLIATNAGGSSTFSTLRVGDIDPDSVINGNIADVYFRNGSLDPGTQLYVNVDGTNTGWRGLATVDMLPGTPSLQQVYDVGTDIVTQYGPVTLLATTTGSDLFPVFPWVDAYRTMVSEGFNTDGISFVHGSGTWANQHYIEFFSDEANPPGSPSSSYMMGDTMLGTLHITSAADMFLEAPLDQIILAAVTTTFQSNLVMDGTFVGSNLTPFTTDLYTLGTANRRWNRVFANGVSSTVLSLSTGTLGHDYSTGPISARSVLEVSHATGGVEGFDIVNFTLGGIVTGTTLFTTANRNAGAPFSATGLSGVTSTGMYGYHSPDVGSDMFLFSQANNKSTFIRMMVDEIAIRAGQGTSSTGGIIDMQGVSSTGAGVYFRNGTSSATNQNWDLYARHSAFGERLPGNIYATGTDVYGMYIGFSGGGGGICLDDVNSSDTCPTTPLASIVSEGAINAFDFDLAEMYAVSGTVSAGDVVLLAEDGMAVEQSQGVAYDRRAIGVVSTDPGFLLGRVEGGSPIALAGRVPTKVSIGNGVIKAGDRLTTSPLAGVAMKATRAGQTIGIALEDANVSGVIEVFIQPSFDLSSSIGADGSLVFTNENGSTTFSVDAAGNGYFLGDVSATSFTTHAAFDLAEQYLSADALEPGDIVVASPQGKLMIQRSSDAKTLPMGIISSAPGFVLGAKATGTHPVALAGRVPTKVSVINGEIKAGDLLAPTDIPGVAGKAFEDGPVVGIALEDYNGADIGKIEVFVKSIWYSKPNEAVPQVIENNTYVTNVTASTPDDIRRGLAKIETGAVKVHVTFATLNGYPFIQATPRGLIVGSWSTDNYTDTGFDIILEQPQTFDVVFGWEARALDGSTMMIMSDGTSLLVDPTTGQVIYQEPEEPETSPEVVPEPAPEPTPEPSPEPENP